jgi:hypothetical protein
MSIDRLVEQNRLFGAARPTADLCAESEAVDRLKVALG